MSRFLKIPDAAFDPQQLHRGVLRYVIEEFRGDIENLEYPAGRNAEKLVQFLIDRYGHKFRMYGSAQELLENVQIFTNFPKSHNFVSHAFAPYNVSPTIFYNLKNEKFICKSDLFVILQNMIFDDSDDESSLASIAILLKAHEDELSNGLEFARFNEEVLEEIKKEIDSVMKIKPTNEMAETLRRAFQNGNFCDVLIGLKTLYPNIDANSHMVAQMKEIRSINFDSNPRVFEALLQTAQWMEAIQRVTQAHPEMFHPHSAGSNNRMPITVSVFEDGDQRFVLSGELLTKTLGITRAPLLCKTDDTMTLDDAQRKFETKNVEFIRYPIVRTKHRMVPVPISVPNGIEICVLAVDGLFELLREAIFSLKMFQSPMATPQLIFQIREHCVSEIKSPYFIYIDEMQKMRASWKIALGNVTKAAVRNAKKDGFTVQNLKNELEHLGLTTTFPEIQDYAEVVYSEVDKIKKGVVLRTCDLFDALEHCQLICIINHYEFIKEFLHNQKGCSRVMGYKCELCESAASNSEVNHQNRGKNEKNKDKKKEKLAQKESDDTGSDDRNAEAEHLQTSAAVAPESKAASETQRSQKTSANCEKCYRSCEMLNETKKELKSSENKMKNLEKKISAKERELEESKQKNEEEKKNLNDQISNLKSSISQIESDSLRKGKTQKDLEDQVTRLEKSLELQNQKMFDVNGIKMKLEESHKKLEEQIFQLEQELNAEKKKTLESLELSRREKLEFETQILEKNRKLEEFKESEIRMKAENEINQRMIQQLMDKLGPSGVGYSNLTTSKMQKCQICWNELNVLESVKCHQCRRPVHIKCANSGLERYKTCPSCRGEFQDPPTRNHFSSFF